MSNLCDELKQQQAAVEARYLELVTKVAREESVDPQEAATILRECGRTAEQFEREVERTRRITELRGEVSRLEREDEACVNTMRKTGEELQKAKKARDKAAEAAEVAAAAYQGFIYERQLRSNQLQKARSELRQLERPE